MSALGRKPIRLDQRVERLGCARLALAPVTMTTVNNEGRRFHTVADVAARAAPFVSAAFFCLIWPRHHLLLNDTDNVVPPGSTAVHQRHHLVACWQARLCAEFRRCGGAGRAGEFERLFRWLAFNESDR